MKTKNTKKTKKAPAETSVRALVWDILQSLSRKNTVQSAFSKEKTEGFSARDTALISELLYGTVRAYPRLEFLLARLVPKPQKLPPSLLPLLYMAMYELLYLDRIPPHATLHSAVELCKKRFGLGLAKLVNAALRHCMRLGEKIQDESYYTEFSNNALEGWAAFYGLPLWIAKLWTKTYGEEKARAYAKASAASPWASVRLNSKRPEWESLQSLILKETEGRAVGLSGVQYKPSMAPEHLSLYLKTGKLSLQGAGSQKLLQALSPKDWPQPIWETCAGHGGKSMALLEQELELFAVSDVHRLRLRGLRDETKRLVLPRPPIFCASAVKPPFAENIAQNKAFNTIFLDVPCSGLGTLSRHPDIRLHLQEKDVQDLVELQERILLATWPLLPSGGYLVYATCTLNPDENEGQIDKLLQRHSGASLLQQWQSEPDEYGSDMMYGAVIVKE